MKNVFAASIALAWAVFAVSVRAGDSDTETLRAEIRAMRQAYEGRISALEGEIKELKVVGVARKETTAKIDDALANKSLSTEKTAGRILNIESGNAVRGGPRLNLGGYTEFTYIDRGDTIGQFNSLKTVAEIGAQLNERIKLYIEVEQENGDTIEGEGGGEGELEIEQAWLDYSINKAINFRAGSILVPVGRFNL